MPSLRAADLPSQAMDLVGALHLHIHVLHLFQHVKGSPIDYVAVALAAFASWAGFPGPGEPVLIAAAIVASKHKLGIGPLVFWASVGATVGGVAGWALGLMAGRRLLTARGPLHGFRVRAVERGEELFRRFAIPAIIFTPSWVAGIERSRARVYLPVNLVSATLLWAAPIAYGAYYAGPPLLDLVGDLGVIATVALVLFVVVVVGGELLRRRRARAAAGT
jgi:membrane protein DedA with SNARE-associated domain